MHPAISVICFTLLSGAGYGLLGILCVDSAVGLGFELESARRNWLTVLSLVLITVGLLCSTFHLASPRNAWRAFFRFKTSWLSREGVFAVLVFPFALLWLLVAWNENPSLPGGYTKLFAIITLFLAAATLFSTGMIYACLKTIRQWNTSLTPANYLLLGTMLGALLLHAFGAAKGSGTLALGVVIVAAATKIIYFFWIGQPAGSTINSALGFTRATVRLLDVGHSSGTFLTDEFGYEVARAKLIWLRLLCVAGAFAVPLLLLMLVGTDSTVAALLALLTAFIGVYVERWLFFAEARHVVNLYHGAQRT
jgi:DMSO reductase anchor subunit